MSASSILDLRREVAERLEKKRKEREEGPSFHTLPDERKREEFIAAKRAGGSLPEPANRGVEERNKRDMETIAAEQGLRATALERKAALYDKLARGEAGADGEVYNVDFQRKEALASEAGGAADGASGRGDP